MAIDARRTGLVQLIHVNVLINNLNELLLCIENNNHDISTAPSKLVATIKHDL